MIAGVSKFFDIIPVGDYSLDTYSASMSMIGEDGTIVFQDVSVPKSEGGTRFEVRVQTAELSQQSYRLVVFVVNSENENVSVVYDEQIKIEEVF